MLTTRFTDLVGCSVPIQQAGMGAVASPELAAAVSEAGGLGMLGMARSGGRTVRGLRIQLDRMAALTSRPFGINFIVTPESLADAEPGCFELAASSARLIEFFYGWPNRSLVDLVHQGGALVSWQVGSREEAVAAAEVGCDLIITQGIAAGGHVRGTIGLQALLDEVLAEVDLPVLAAGGIGTGRAVAAALTAGASGVRVGTRFVAAAEAGAHPEYVDRLIAAHAEDTVYTEAFSTNWPNAPHRVLRSCVAAAEAFEDQFVGETLDLNGAREKLQRFGSLTVTRDTTGRIDAMSLWAGESVGAVKRVQPAAEILRELWAEAETQLRSVTGAQGMAPV
jgi:NAD(P)H-dependent flavin oxidoreductase YrpB (nitropropane dioxygenase family)